MADPRALSKPTTCRKVRYVDEAAAKFDARKHHRRQKRSTKKRTYLCPICGFWHLTAQTQRKKARHG